VKNIKIVKGFLNYATDRGYNRNLEFRKFKLTEKDGDVIFLTFDELMKVFKVELKEQRLQRVRDIFCLSCFTGLRYSDVTRIKPENIVNGSIIIRSQKTRDTLTIPLNSFAKEILGKYEDTADTCLPKMSIQKLNDYLKEVGKFANLNSPLTVTRYRGAEKIETTKPKYEFLTSHIARKTFVTNSLYFGMKTEILMDITGHKTHSAFKRYYKIVDSIRKSEMNRTWDKQLA
jgi:integrase